MGYCSQLPACKRAGCGRPACDHDAKDPHPILVPAGQCEAYVWTEDPQQSEFQPGGGGFGGGGATGGW